MVPSDLISLPGVLFNAPVRLDLVHRTVVWQLAKRRQGTSKTKNRSEVAGSGRKVRPQKGSGRSRQGAITSPVFRGGGRVHGPVPRSYDFPLQRNVRRAALRSALTSKMECGQLWIVGEAEISDAKTSTVVACMDRYGWRSALIVDDVPTGVAGVHPSLHAASHNVQQTLAMNVVGLNVYDMLSFDMLVLSRAAVDSLSARFSKHHWLF